MDAGFVRQVHQIVDDEAPVALQAGEHAALADPFRTVVPVEIRQLGGVGEGGVAGPDPDETVFLDSGETAYAGRRVDRLLRGHERAAAG
jgi:hypothetical protein